MGDTRKVVINGCFGGFSLGEAGMRRFAELKGVSIFPEKDPKWGLITNYWTVPPDRRPPPFPDGKAWAAMTPEQRQAHNEAWQNTLLSDRDIPRDDPDLVRVVEELGKAASGQYAHLEVVEIPADVDYEIAEYDGNEHVAEKHRTWP